MSALAKAGPLALVISMVAACSVLPAGATPVPTAVVHLQNRISNVVVAQGGSLLMPAEPSGSARDVVLVAPCGGSADIAIGPVEAGRQGMLALLIDPHGVLDQMAEAVGYEADKLGHAGDLSIIWSTGEIDPAGPERWLVIDADGVTLADRGAGPTSPMTPCPPWPVAPG
jgi:hypothetical protein